MINIQGKYFYSTFSPSHMPGCIRVSGVFGVRHMSRKDAANILRLARAAAASEAGQ